MAGRADPELNGVPSDVLEEMRALEEAFEDATAKATAKARAIEEEARAKARAIEEEERAKARENFEKKKANLLASYLTIDGTGSIGGNLSSQSASPQLSAYVEHNSQHHVESQARSASCLPQGVESPTVPKPHGVPVARLLNDNFSHDSSASSIVPPHKISKIKSSSSTVFSTSCLFQASPKFPSASNASKTLCVSESAYFAIHDTISEGDNCKLKFSLTDIAGCVGFQGQDVKNSERYALECFSHYFKGFDQLNNIKLICDKEILQMKRLEGLETSTAARIDIVVRQNDYFVLGIEVLSGPKMSETISKCIIGAADTLRMLRLDDEKEVNGVTFFAVPSLSHPGCVVKVEVVWQHLQFHSTLTYYFEAQESIEAIKDEAIQQLKFCNLIPSNVNRPPLIKLYDNDIKFLDIKDGVQQYSQRHIIIEDNNFIYKVLYRSTEKMAVFDLLTWQYSFKKIINVVRYYRSNKAKYLIYCYRKVKFRPLRLEEASQCLRPLLRSVSKAIEELHGYNLSHNDIRLPNICFNEDYEAVLIDIDSTCGIDRLHDYFINGVRSCMYNVKELQIETRNVTGKQTDYMQLGWMVTYILDPSADEHDRTFQSLKDDIKELKFVVNLIQKGSWDENLFKDFCLDSNTELRDIISE